MQKINKDGIYSLLNKHNFVEKIKIDDNNYDLEKNLLEFKKLLSDLVKKELNGSIAITDLSDKELKKLFEEIEYKIIRDKINIVNKDDAKQYIKVANTNKKVLEYLLSIDEYFILEITNEEFLNDKKMLLKQVLLQDWMLLSEVGEKIKNDPEVIHTILVHFNDENFSDDYRLDNFIDLVIHPDLPNPIIGKELKKTIVEFMGGLDYDEINVEIAQKYKEKNNEIMEFLKDLSSQKHEIQNVKEENKQIENNFENELIR